MHGPRPGRSLVAVGYAVGPAILSRRLDGLPSIGVMALSLALSAVVYVPSPRSSGRPDPLRRTCCSRSSCSACCAPRWRSSLFGELIAEVGPVRATVITYINPAVAAVLGVLVLSETFTVGDGGRVRPRDPGSTLATRRPQETPVEVAATAVPLTGSPPG